MKRIFTRQSTRVFFFAIALQEQAGIDFITDGEWRRRTYFTGFSQSVQGFRKDVIEVGTLSR